MTNESFVNVNAPKCTTRVDDDPFYFALIDVVLEDEDGIQCARQLRSVSPSTRMVVVSAYPDRGFRKQALSAGAVAFVDKKDLDTASLRQVIEDALR